MTDLNLAGESYAHSLIAAGRVDRSSAWSFDVAHGSALLGKNGDDWENYSRYHLGLDRSASDKTKARYKFPFVKANRLYRSGLIAAKRRAAQQGDSAIEKVTGELIDLIDKPKSTAGHPSASQSRSNTSSLTRLRRRARSKATDRCSTTRTTAAI